MVERRRLHTVELIPGDCVASMERMLRDGVLFDAVVTDPPYHLIPGSNKKRLLPPGVAEIKKAASVAARGFLGHAWDGGDIAFRPDFWKHVYDVMKPGAHLVAFGGSRTFHRLVCAVDDAGFELRDTLMWLHGTGFPKSEDISKGIDRTLGKKRAKIRVDAKYIRKPAVVGGGHRGHRDNWMDIATELGYHEMDGDVPASPEAEKWLGWHTALKPAFEPIVLARKPLDGTASQSVLKYGTGALNVDACRIPLPKDDRLQEGITGRNGKALDENGDWGFRAVDRAAGLGRWPANVLHDGSEEVMRNFPFDMHGGRRGATRIFYTAKANEDERAGADHPTVKPLDLMAWLVKLITPPGGTVLDPFSGSGTTLQAAYELGFSAVGCEADPEYCKVIAARITAMKRHLPRTMFRAVAKPPSYQGFLRSTS